MCHLRCRRSKNQAAVGLKQDYICHRVPVAWRATGCSHARPAGPYRFDVTDLPSGVQRPVSPQQGLAHSQCHSKRCGYLCANGGGRRSHLTGRILSWFPGKNHTWNAPFCGGIIQRWPAVFVAGFDIRLDLIGSHQSMVWPWYHCCVLSRVYALPFHCRSGNRIKLHLSWQPAIHARLRFGYFDIYGRNRDRLSFLTIKYGSVCTTESVGKQFNIRIVCIVCVLLLPRQYNHLMLIIPWTGGRSAVFPPSAANFTWLASASESVSIITIGIIDGSQRDAKCRSPVWPISAHFQSTVLHPFSIKRPLYYQFFLYLWIWFAKTYQYKDEPRSQMVRSSWAAFYPVVGYCWWISRDTSPPIPCGAEHSDTNGYDTWGAGYIDLRVRVAPCRINRSGDCAAKSSNSQSEASHNRQTMLPARQHIPFIPGTCDNDQVRHDWDLRDAFSLHPFVHIIIRWGIPIFDKTIPQASYANTLMPSDRLRQSLRDVSLDFKRWYPNQRRFAEIKEDETNAPQIILKIQHDCQPAANGCDSIVFYQILVETVKATLLNESAGCTARVGKSPVIRTITGGRGHMSICSAILHLHR